MNIADYIAGSVTGLNSALTDDVKDLTQEQAEWTPAPGANPIGFIFWHFMRIQDNMVHGFLEKPSVWESEKWYEKLGMEATDTGMGFDEAGVGKAAAMPLAQLVAYAGRVSEDSEGYFKSLDEAGLDAAPNPDRPRSTILKTVRAFLISHGWWHDGEIKYIRGMQGMPFPM